MTTQLTVLTMALAVAALQPEATMKSERHHDDEADVVEGPHQAGEDGEAELAGAEIELSGRQGLSRSRRAIGNEREQQRDAAEQRGQIHWN
jgi:hypothetical protein